VPRVGLEPLSTTTNVDKSLGQSRSPDDAQSGAVYADSTRNALDAEALAAALLALSAEARGRLAAILLTPEPHQREGNEQ
jgi:hypothetical protein